MPIVQLNEQQKAQVRAWLENGLQLGEIQKRLEADLGISATYLDVKMLVSDLQVLPKDPEPANGALKKPAGGDTNSDKRSGAPTNAGLGGTATSPAGRVSVAVDQLTKPGAVLSGSVTFSDGKKGTWYVDETGRIGVAPAERGYRPSQSDMSKFQVALEEELSRQGF